MSIVIGNKTISKISIGGKTVSKIEIGGKIAYELDESPDYLCFTDVSGSANKLKLTKNNSAPTVSLEYSTDKVNWTTWTESNNVRTYTIPANGKVYLRGDNTAFANSNSFRTFSSTGKMNASGDLMTIIDKTGQTKTLGNYAFMQLFCGCTTLMTAPSISAESVGTKGMFWMFADCTSLVTPPDLSNITTVGNYGMISMFNGCTALKTPPDLSNITSVGDYGMYQMFYNCTALTKVYAPTIKWDTSKTEKWLNGVVASGTLYADSSIIDSIPTSDVSGCPSGWTKESL